MKDNIYDIVADKVKIRLGRVYDKLHETSKGANPYRKKLVSPRERYFEYMNIPEEQKMFARQNFPQEMTMYEQEMQKLTERYANG